MEVVWQYPGSSFGSNAARPGHQFRIVLLVCLAVIWLRPSKRYCSKAKSADELLGVRWIQGRSVRHACMYAYTYMYFMHDYTQLMRQVMVGTVLKSTYEPHGADCCHSLRWTNLSRHPPPPHPPPHPSPHLRAPWRHRARAPSPVQPSGEDRLDQHRARCRRARNRFVFPQEPPSCAWGGIAALPVTRAAGSLPRLYR